MKLDGLNLASLAAPRGRNSSTFGSTKLRGAFLLVKPNGRKEWHQRYTRPDRRRNTIKLGDWPAVDEDGAVELGTANKALLRRGVDPVDFQRGKVRAKRAEQFLKGMAVTQQHRLAHLAATFLEDCEQRLRPGTVKNYRIAFNRYLLLEHGGDDVRFFDAAAFESEIQVLAKRSKSARANLLAATRAMLSFGVERGALPTNPLLGRRKMVRAVSIPARERVLSSQELHRFLNELPSQPVSGDIQTALLLQLHTGLRIGEVLAVEWASIDFRTRIMRHPASIMKNKRPAET